MSKEARSTNDEVSNPPARPAFDLEERTAVFGEEVVRFARTLAVCPVTKPIISQLVRAATSVGANYCEADDAGSGKEFRYRISICRRESRESKHWLRMVAAALPEAKEAARSHWREAHELNLIFASIHRRSKERSLKQHEEDATE